MHLLYFFNPGHETAVLLGTTNYTAPTNVRKMQHDLQFLPAWYANKDDLVWVDNITDSLKNLDFLPQDVQPTAIPVSLKSLKQYGTTDKILAAPWGLSPHVLKLFERLKQDAKLEQLQVPIWNELFFQLTGRQSAAECLQHIHHEINDLPTPEAPHFCSNIKELTDFMATHKPPFVLKTPYSSSGRGLLWVENHLLDIKTKKWIEGAINKQKSISIEQGLKNRQDFAMEFYSDGKGNILFEGLSIFNTEKRGAYSGNILESQESMRKRLTKLINEQALSATQEAVTKALKKIYSHVYKGYIGVDMLLYEQADHTLAIHPCVEINMRYTMGMVALKLYQRYIDPKSTGYYVISFNKDKGDALKMHEKQTLNEPLLIHNGKIKQGYLSLCPINNETHYRAYLSIKQNK